MMIDGITSHTEQHKFNHSFTQEISNSRRATVGCGSLVAYLLFQYGGFAILRQTFLNVPELDLLRQKRMHPVDRCEFLRQRVWDAMVYGFWGSSYSTQKSNACLPYMVLDPLPQQPIPETLS